MAYIKNASELARKFIQGKIESGDWKPGDKIWTESQLSKTLGISRTSVRQALDSFVDHTVLRRVQGSGTYLNSNSVNLGIVSVSDLDVLDILEFRRYFEYGNMMMFMENHDKADVEQLERHYRRMCSARDDIKNFYLEDYMFHNAIAKGTKKIFIDNISSALSSTLMQNPHHFVSTRIGLEYHDTILQYIKDGSTDLAATCTKHHIEATIMAFKNNIERKTTLSGVR